MSMSERAASSWVQVGDERVRMLRDGARAFPAMLEAIGACEREVLLEMYWWGTDATGTRFRDALVDRARAGAAVRVIFDSVGSWSIDEAFLAPILAAGGEALEYHPVSPASRRFRLDRVLRRDHRKLLVVDGRDGFCGGINIGDPWAPAEWGGEDWRDDMLHVRGPAARELRSLFYETWRRCGRTAPGDVAPIARVPTSDVWVLANRGPLGTRRLIRRFYLSKIRSARRMIDIANAYFVPDRSVRRALRDAVQRGVRVRLLLPERSDLPIVQLASEHLTASLWRAGVRIWLYPDRVMHGKVAILDGSFTTVGSYNLDHVSWRFNLECNLAVLDEVFAGRVRAGFEADLGGSNEVQEATFAGRPLWRRALGWLAYLVRAVL
jgi:cardiolipin synthase